MGDSFAVYLRGPCLFKMLTLNTNRGRQFAAALIARGPPPHADRRRAPAGKMGACLLVELRRREGIDSQRTGEENRFLGC